MMLFLLRTMDDLEDFSLLSSDASLKEGDLEFFVF